MRTASCNANACGKVYLCTVIVIYIIYIHSPYICTNMIYKCVGKGCAFWMMRGRLRGNLVYLYLCDDDAPWRTNEHCLFDAASAAEYINCVRNGGRPAVSALNIFTFIFLSSPRLS